MSVKNIKKEESEYPKLLGEINKPPSPLFYKGRLPESDELCIGIVGTRKAGDYGRKAAKEISFNLSKKGITVVSGLALGIDEAAHIGALEAGARTLAVLGHGLDMIYPKENKALAKRIVESSGALLSEYRTGEKPKPERFLERNRIISGLSKAVVIIEAPSRSGALNTARHALEQNREIFVVPGRAENKNFKGSHKLIREGAGLVINAEEILDDLGIKT